MIIKNETIVETNIYYKATDSKSELLFSSYSPKHTKYIQHSVVASFKNPNNAGVQNKRLLALKQALLEKVPSHNWGRKGRCQSKTHLVIKKRQNQSGYNANYL